MRIGTRRARVLFWILLALILLLNLPRLLILPTMFDGRDGSPVIITEFLARNQSSLVDDDGEYVDWIELYNRSPYPVDLEGWSLTDNPELPDKWRFPAVQLPPATYLIVFASGKNGVAAPDAAINGALPSFHTNFRLQGQQGFLALYPPTTRRFLDSLAITYGPQRVDVSYGRLTTTAGADAETYQAFTNPTPGAANDERTTLLPEVASVLFSKPHGLYTNGIEVALSSPMADAVIWYTTDGRVPSSENATRYVHPLTITTTTIVRATATLPEHLPATVTTQSYIFPAAVLQQPATPAGWPLTWGVHSITFGGGVAGEPVQADYAMDQQVTQDPAQQALLLRGLQELPSLSLALPVDDFAALYRDPQRRGVEAEYALSVELLPPGLADAQPDGSPTTDEHAVANPAVDQLDPSAPTGFQINAGIRIQGGAGRWEYMPKHSFRLFFKEIYGATKLEYRFFSDSPITSFDTLVLRAGVDRSFAGHPDTVDLRQTTYTRDQWLRQTQIALSGVGSHGRFVHLYINGLYWGLYNVVERPDASFAAAYYGGDKEEWAAVNHSGSVSGQIDRFAVLLQLAAAGGLADPIRYATILEFIDPAQFSDYLIANWYAGNSDWPENNWYANVQYPAGRNLFFVWDGELTWAEGALIQLGTAAGNGEPFSTAIRQLFMALMENESFRLLFADRLYAHLSAGGALSESQVQARWRAMTDPLANAIVAESARWGDARSEPPINQADWRQASAHVLAQMAGNDTRLIRLARAAGYYPLIDPPQFSPYQQTFSRQLRLTLRAEDGEIYYTLDGSDPRVVGSAIPAPSAQRYRTPLLLTEATTVQARSRVQQPDGTVIWSALAPLVTQRVGQQAKVRITELMYHAPGGPDYEYLEITNQGDLAADLSRAYFEGIDYRFAVGTVLEPGAALVLVHDFRTFRRHYAEREIGGIYGGELSNYGETITLFDRNGAEVTSVTYGNSNGWPVTAAGQGDALLLVHPDGDPNNGRNWRASVVYR